MKTTKKTRVQDQEDLNVLSQDQDQDCGFPSPDQEQDRAARSIDQDQSFRLAFNTFHFQSNNDQHNADSRVEKLSQLMI